MFALMVGALCSIVSAQEGVAKVPMSRWEQMLEALEAADTRTLAPVPVLQVDRQIEGSFRRGVFSGTLVTRVRVPVGHEDKRIPILGDAASIAGVTLDGKTTSLLPEGGRYTIAVDGPGDHVVRVEFFTGREDDRFARRLQLELPESGPTKVSLWVPEGDIEPVIAQGAVTSLRPENGGTRIEGQLDGRGTLDVTWKGKQVGDVLPVKIESQVHTLFTLHEALVRGVAVIDTTVLEGETDRIGLRLPEGVEVVDVQGESVLQWRTEAGRLVVLLRYLVSDRAQVRVQFQFPVDLDQAVELRMPLPESGVPFKGAVGVAGPAGLQAKVEGLQGAVALRDLPPELAALTPNPLLLGFELEGDPTLVLAVTRQAEVEMTTTSVDELEAATVLIEDGAEITKAQLHVRNQTRQYLSVRLPEGAVLTHARLDDRPIRPATSPDGSTLLIPLIQSERLADGHSQTWVVREGDTLGAIADRFYGDPSRWGRIVDDNQLFDTGNLTVGQVLQLNDAGAGTVPVSRFVLELSWTRTAEPMGWLGRRELALPELDVDVGNVEWHVYVPESLEPLSFGGNLSAYSHIRYDHVRRLRQFLDLVWRNNDAWAGEPGYSSILQRRKSIYAAESSRGRQEQEAKGSFPLVGDKHRFKRLLPGREVPRLSVSWIARDALPVVRIGALLAAVALALTWLRGHRGGRLGAVVGLVALLVVAWFVEGVHRRILWGIDLGLLVAIVRAGGPALVERFRAGPHLGTALLDGWSFRAVGRALGVVLFLGVLLFVPLLWSSLFLAVLAFKVRVRR